MGPPSGPGPRRRPPRAGVVRRLPGLARGGERLGRLAPAVGAPAGRRAARLREPRRADVVLRGAAARGATARDAGPCGRRLRLHLRRVARDRAGDAHRLRGDLLPPHDLAARRRPAPGDGGAGRGARRALPRAPGQRARQGGEHQSRPAADPGRPGARARRRPRPHAGRPRRGRRVLRRPGGRPRADAARLLQPRLHPALRGGPPRAVRLLPRALPGQGPPRRRLLVRVGRGPAPARAARGGGRGDGDDRRGLPHHHQAARRGVADPLPRRDHRPGPGARGPRRLPAPARPLGARQPRGAHHRGEPAVGARPDAPAAAELPREPARLPRRARPPAAARGARRGAVDGRAAARRLLRRARRALASRHRAHARRGLGAVPRPPADPRHGPLRAPDRGDPRARPALRGAARAHALPRDPEGGRRPGRLARPAPAPRPARRGRRARPRPRGPPRRCDAPGRPARPHRRGRVGRARARPRRAAPDRPHAEPRRAAPSAADGVPRARRGLRGPGPRGPARPRPGPRPHAVGRGPRGRRAAPAREPRPDLAPGARRPRAPVRRGRRADGADVLARRGGALAPRGGDRPAVGRRRRDPGGVLPDRRATPAPARGVRGRARRGGGDARPEGPGRGRGGVTERRGAAPTRATGAGAP
ncbi:MAG: hypothetical protein AVDCRST_MAG13-898 [uncultured Solirubrobacteraceae bacterium]|uniref:Uncharacterized protein n=1 Tax=uncultured Solirubrobacteraceae bacterium TaxID=1162706 RepID=A0A6J4RLJ9_9ACTN|nr:MAG: hypothetical protein AVDCRST_MAG13-898 [uncultured Solirubrobacteraceae bacterium]